MNATNGYAAALSVAAFFAGTSASRADTKVTETIFACDGKEPSLDGTSSKPVKLELRRTLDRSHDEIDEVLKVLDGASAGSETRMRTQVHGTRMTVVMTPPGGKVSINGRGELHGEPWRWTSWSWRAAPLPLTSGESTLANLSHDFRAKLRGDVLEIEQTMSSREPAHPFIATLTASCRVKR